MGSPYRIHLVEGVVRRAGGTPAAHIFLALTCSDPHVDFLGSTTTDSQGRYRIEGNLGPVGLVLPLLDPDTLRAQCVLLTSPPPLSLDSVEVRFWRDRAAVVPLVVDLQLPS